MYFVQPTPTSLTPSYPLLPSLTLSYHLLLQRQRHRPVLRHHRLELPERGIRVVVEVLLLRPFRRQPVAEPARRRTLAPRLLLRGADGEVVGVLVLRMPLVAPHPRPLRVVEPERAVQLL